MIYLDHNATTPLCAEALQAMMPLFTSPVGGNASSPHRPGAEARYHLEKSRRRILSLLSARKDYDLFITCGATEANNLAIQGIAHARKESTGYSHIVVSSTEHKSVLESCFALQENDQFNVTILPVNKDGRIEIQDFRDALTKETILVCVMLANNETGSIQPVEHLVSATRADSNAHFHCDAVQAIGRIPVNFAGLGCDSFVGSAHKFYGPFGCGFLALRKGATRPRPLHYGGAQEDRLRPGTENVPAAVGMARALEVAVNQLATRAAEEAALRARLWQELAHRVPGILRNTPASDSLPGTLNVSFPGIVASRLVMELDQRGIAVAAGSACTSQDRTGSHVVLAMTGDEERAIGALRIGIGRATTWEDLMGLLEALPASLSAAADR